MKTLPRFYHFTHIIHKYIDSLKVNKLTGCKNKTLARWFKSWAYFQITMENVMIMEVIHAHSDLIDLGRDRLSKHVPAPERA